MSAAVLKSASGYGVLTGGRLCIRTVSTSVRNAMLNGLVLYCGYDACDPRFGTEAAPQDEWIADAWSYAAAPRGLAIVACEAVSDGVPIGRDALLRGAA